MTTTNTQSGGFEQPIGNNCDAVANIFGAAGALASYALLPQKEHEPIFDTRAAIEQSPYFTAAVKMFRADQGAIKLLGEPIRHTGFDLRLPFNFCDGQNAQMRVYVTGPIDRGVLCFWASLNDAREWKVTRLEVELDKNPDKPLVIDTAASITSDCAPESIAAD